MSIADDVQEKFIKFSKQAKNTFDTAKIELKIKSYERDCKKFYERIGKLVYDSHRRNSVVYDEEINDICSEIDRIKQEIKDLKNQIDDIKSGRDVYGEEEEKYSDDSEDCSFKKSANDLKAARTEDGIKFLKFCSECGTGNEPDAKFCAKCAHKFENANKTAK